MNNDVKEKEEVVADTEPMEPVESAEPEELEEPAPTKQKKQGGGGGAFTAALLALAALGASFYLYQQQEIQNKDLRALEQGVDKLLSVVEQRHQTLLEHLNTVTAQQQAQTDARLQQMERLLDDTRSRLGQDRSAWSLAEAEHLVRIAEHGLTLEHDTTSAIAALRTAKGRLEVEDPKRFAAVIARLDGDIGTLSAIQLPDRDAMAKSLSAIAAKIEQYPLARQVKPSVGARPDVSAESEKRSGWDKIWYDLSNLITIRHEDEVVVQPMLPPERRYFLQQNLLLKLESARLALLLDNTAAWHSNLAETANWLQRYFDRENPAVSDAVAKLEQLAAIKLAPALPDLAKTRDLIERLSKKAERTMPAPATPAAKPATGEAKPMASKPAAKTTGKQEAKPSAPAAKTKDATPAAPAAAAPAGDDAATTPQPPLGDAQ